MLFFETSGQALLFLLAIPIGYLTALLLHLSGRARKWGPMLDALLLLCGGAALFGFCTFKTADGLHLYHLLAVVTGFFLYWEGPGRLLKQLAEKFKKQEGKTARPSKKHSNDFC